jgi:hypothetical protein
MGVLIAGFSPEEYKNFLNPTKQKSSQNSNHWFVHFYIDRLVVLINRIAYFVFHRFSAYPNNAYLFEKFKSHQFSTISEMSQYDAAVEIFKCFQQCPEFDKQLDPIMQQLELVKQSLNKKLKENGENVILSIKHELEVVNFIPQGEPQAKEESSPQPTGEPFLKREPIGNEESSPKGESSHRINEGCFKDVFNSNLDDLTSSFVFCDISEEENFSEIDAGTEKNRISMITAIKALFTDTTEAKFIYWKIRRYEDAIKGMQKSIEEYFNPLGGIEKFINQAKDENAPEWIIQLLPLLKFRRYPLRNDNERFNQEYLLEIRLRHREGLVDQLRKARKWAMQNPEMQGKDHIDAICFRFYTTLDLNPRCQEVFKAFISFGKEALKETGEHHSLPVHSSNPIMMDLYKCDQLIKQAPNKAKSPLTHQWFNSARGHLNGVYGVTPFDPNRQSNPIHVFFQMIISFEGKAPQIVKDIAMGTPTIEQGNGIAEIAPEFQGFLSHYQRNKLVHVYINNQNFIPPKWWMRGDETVRCQTIHDLADQQFKATLFVITLSQNSCFYEQKRDYSSYHLSFKVFKNELIPQMFDLPSNQTGNYIPDDLEKRFHLRQWSVEAVDLIHQKMFDGREPLTIQERRIFIRLFYQNLTRKILIETKANSYNSSCKDRIDRGAASDAENFAYLAILANCMHQPHVIEFFKMLVFARAIIVRKRSIIEERLNRLVETVGFMFDYQAKLQALHAELFPGVTITIDQFETRLVPLLHP